MKKNVGKKFWFLFSSFSFFARPLSHFQFLSFSLQSTKHILENKISDVELLFGSLGRWKNCKKWEEYQN